MSNYLRDMRKAKRTKELNMTSPVHSYAGSVISHVAQGVLKNSRAVKKDHVIWNPEEDRHGKIMEHDK